LEEEQSMNGGGQTPLLMERTLGFRLGDWYIDYVKSIPTAISASLAAGVSHTQTTTVTDRTYTVGAGTTIDFKVSASPATFIEGATTFKDVFNTFA
jgi:hypothetical protein